jgi:Uma2 family endonuclease
MSIANPKSKLITAEEFEQFANDTRCDLIQGELQPMPPLPGARHGILTFDFAFEIGAYVRAHKLGRCFAAETRFIIERGPDTAIGPDFAFISRERLPKRIPKGFLALAPDLVLEVRSPTDRQRAIQEKVARWLQAGVRLVWELDPATQTVTVYRADARPQKLGRDDTLSGEDVLPGFSLPLRQLFEEEMEA